MIYFLLALKTVAPLFLIILTGILFSRTKVSSGEWVNILNKYALYIGFPALVVASLMHLEPGEQSYAKLILFNSIYFVGMALVVFRIELPEFAAKTIDFFAESVTAVVLFSLGIFLGMQNIGKLKEWYRVFAFVVATMLILPFFYYLSLKMTYMNPEFLKASVIDAAMPLGLTPYALSLQYELDTKLAARVVVLGTFLSVFIIPLWIAVLG